MDFEYQDLGLSDSEKLEILKNRDNLYLELVNVLTDFLKQETKVNRSNRFYEIILYRFVYKFVEDINTIHFLRKTNSIEQTSEPFHVPLSDSEYSELRHSNKDFYRQFFSQFNLDNGFSQSKAKVTSKKRKIKNKLFSLKLSIPSNKKMVMLFSEYQPSYWKEYYHDHRVVSASLRTITDGKKQTVNKEVRERLHNFLIENQVKQHVADPFTFCLPIDLLEDFQEHYQDVLKYTNRVKCNWMVAGWFPDLWSTIFCALLVDKGTGLSIIQHGGNYGENEHCFVESIEKRVSDQFLSWSQKNYDEFTVPVAPTRLIMFKRKYDALKANNSNLVKGKYKALVADCFHYKTLSFGVLIGWLGIKKNIINFLENYGDGEGTGVLVRLYYGKFAKNFEFSEELKQAFPNVTIHDENTPMESDMIESESIYVNYRYSTLRWEGNYIGKKVHLLPELEVSAV